MKGVFFYYWLAERLSAVLPKKAAYALARFAGRIYGRFLTSDIRAIRLNQAAVFGATEAARAEACARRMIFEFGLYLTDLFYSREISEEFVRKNVRLSGLRNLNAGLAAGRGVILASAHLGHWELGAMALAVLGYPMHALALTHRDPRIERMFLRRRNQQGIQVIHAENSLKDCYRALQENRILAMNADRNYGKEGVPVRFFGREVTFPQGLERLAQATGAAVLPAFFVRAESGRYELEIGPPMISSEKPLAQLFAELLEKKIKAHPFQWFLFQPFWEAPRWPV